MTPADKEDRTESGETSLAKAIAAVRRGDYRLARSLLRRAAETAPDDNDLQRRVRAVSEWIDLNACLGRL